tara:strand:- start:629 stop:847 length:219 start_codon:yes stop_codon:yes gene_type:complete
VAQLPPNFSVLTAGGPHSAHDGFESQTVYVRSTKNFVYRSKDEGKTWEKQNWKMEKASAEEDGAHLCWRTLS